MSDTANGWKFGWGAIGSLVAIALLITGGVSYFAGSTAADAVIENRVTNLERRQTEILNSMSETNKRLNDLITYLWQERSDRRRAQGKED